MASKVMLGYTHFQQGRRREEIVNVGYLGTTATDPALRVQQLEHNIRFLQEQHQIMLSGLHREVEVLRRRNRDMQFRLVFSKGNVSVLQTSPTSSPEEDLSRKHSPTEINVTPLQVELLERDIAQLKTNLSEARTRNVYLQGVVDEQKKVIQALEQERGEIAAVGKKIGTEVVKKNAHVERKDSGSQQLESKVESVEELQDKLEDSDRMVRRLRRENEEQRKEIVSLRTAVAKALAENRHRNPRSQHQYSQTSRFPPVHPHPQNQWHNSAKHSANRESSELGDSSSGSTTSLPLLRDKHSANTSQNNHHSGSNHRRGYPRHHGGARSHRNSHRDHPQD